MVNRSDVKYKNKKQIINDMKESTGLSRTELENIIDSQFRTILSI